ncbi:MAG: UDP-N-acetylglucosamine 1-carboxyvinyltransferase [Chitinivibrionales bacterium]|nr:UDP-N-acetylglucosamine 1-carboxyvinyltransferase [Chitinivibrionales bacterium]
MSTFIVEGGARLEGAIAVSGNKNEALPAIAAAMLSADTVTLRNFPDIGDVRNMLAIARHLGADVSGIRDGTVTIHAGTITDDSLPVELSSKIRGSILFASALLLRHGHAVVPQPGGDSIGRRPLDTHFRVFEALGARLDVVRPSAETEQSVTLYSLSAPDGLTGADIFLDEASVTATENALIAASGAKGRTTIANAASEPHVQGLCALLKAMGARIEGIGSNILTVEGTDRFTAVEHTLGSDYIEVGSLVGLAAATGSSLTLDNVDTEHLRMILFQFERLNVHLEIDHAARRVAVPGDCKLRVRRDLGNAIPHIADGPWPAFPADLMSILLVTATQAEGTCLIHEKMFESRLFFVDWLISMGAQIVLCDPHRAVVAGASRLYAATITSPDIRAGMALLIAALAAEGTSTIHNVVQIDRGYVAIDKRLNALGASIARTPERRTNG